MSLDAGPSVAHWVRQVDTRQRAGAIHIPPNCRGVIIEGVGACRQRSHEWYDGSVWVQTEADRAYRRVVARDSDLLAFIDDWTAAENPSSQQTDP